MIWRAAYAPFGRRLGGAHAAARPGDAADPGFDLALRLPGQLEDPETGLHYNDHRYYDPDTATNHYQRSLTLNEQLHTTDPTNNNWTRDLAITLRELADGDGEKPAMAWDAKRDFPADTATPLTSWEQLAQAVLCSNEFLFVD